MIKIEPNQIKIQITDNAKAQLWLIQQNDYTIKDQVFRLKVDGKGCGGFDYALGFTKALSDDLVISFPHNEGELFLSIDPFTAFYCQSGTIDFVTDYENDIEGFRFKNENESKYRGKFFKNEELLPKMK